MYIYIYIYIYIYQYVYICIYIGMYEYLYICIYKDLVRGGAELEDKDADLRRCPSSPVSRLCTFSTPPIRMLHSWFTAACCHVLRSYARAPFRVWGTRTPSCARTNRGVARFERSIAHVRSAMRA